MIEEDQIKIQLLKESNRCIPINLLMIRVVGLRAAALLSILQEKGITSKKAFESEKENIFMETGITVIQQGVGFRKLVKKGFIRFKGDFLIISN